MKPESEEKFLQLIRKFDCAVAQLKHRKIPLSIEEWSIILAPDMTYAIKPNSPANPFSVLLEGKRLNKRIFGRRNGYEAYNQFLGGTYLYLEIEAMFGLDSCLRYAMNEGLAKNAYNTNIYIQDYANSPEYGVAFDVGRYLLHKHFGLKYKYRTLELFNRV